MMMQEPKSKSENSSKNNIMQSSNKIEPVDPNLNLPEDIKNSENHIKISIQSNYESSDIKKQLSIELLNEILRNPNNTKEENEKILKLIQKIKEKKYYQCYGDLNGPDSDIIRNFEQSEKIIENPLLLELPDILDYDVELYKIGKTCSGLKQRYAIIKRGGFFSSKKPLDQINEKNKTTIKDKTQYLPGSQVFIETKDDPNRTKSEWKNKNKNYRIRIDYSLSHFDNSSKVMRSSFFLYFDDENKMREVELMLFGFRLSESEKKNIKKNLKNINTILFEGNRFYTIMKILAVKNKIKQRKLVFNKINNSLNCQIYGKLNIGTKLLKRLSLQRKETIRNQLIKDNPPPQPEVEFIVRAAPPKVKLFEYQYSDFMPLISNVNPACGNISYKHQKLRENKKSLNDLIEKYKSLKNEIPDEMINLDNELSENGACFNIPDGVQIQKNENYDYDEENIDFKLEPELCNNAKYIYFDKNKPEIIFKEENNNNMNNYNEYEKNEANILSDNNIYEISNIILNSNINLNGKQENNLIILGPKIDNNKGINYKYKDNNNSYTDPENYKIKKKTINLNNKEEVDGTTIQIYQSELSINNQKMQSLFENITGSMNPNINVDNAKKLLLFWYRIKLSDIQNIDSPYIPPKDFKDNICFIEYNHQYFIPKEYFNNNSKLIIENYCLPVISFSEKENNISGEKIGYIGKLLSPINIGYTEIDYKEMKNGKYKYELKNNGIEEPNCYLLIDGGPDKSNNLYLNNNIDGKDYSIGNDSYIEKVINKDFIEKAKNNPEIPEEIKNKYFNICFDSETENNFLFRPNEDMDENEFIRDISSQISNEDMQKIKHNKKYNFLPYCEKYIDEKTLYESNNLKFLTEEQKQNIIENYNEGDWIYKMPEIKVKLLSKNLGVKKENNSLSQLIYYTGEEESFPIENLNRDSKDKIIPISENNFNVFDMNEMHNMDNFENFQWKTGIKFNNPLQMHTFLKLLTLARQNINIKKKDNNNNNIIKNNFKSDKIFEFDYQKKNKASDNDEIEFGFDKSQKKCEINVEFIDFREDFVLEKDPTLLEVIVFIEGYVEKSIILNLKDSKYNFGNSLLINDEKIKNTFSKYYNGGKNGKKEYFPKKVKLSKKKFNKGQKKIILGNHLKTQFDFDKNLNNNISYLILVLVSGNGEYYTPLDINQIINPRMCNKLELPLYKKGENNKIYGCIGIDLYELDNSGLSFQERFEELNSKYLNEPLLILKELSNINVENFQKENYHFGLYEPNVFRRKILNFIHNYEEINVDPNDMENNINKDLDILYQKLIDKCVILPKRELFSSYKFYNIKKNYDLSQNTPNSYRKKLGLKLLTAQRHEKFMNQFRQKEWDIYLDNINKSEDNLKGIDYFNAIEDKKILLNNKNEGNKLHSLIYIGIPNPQYRKVIYATLLEISKIYQKTREILYEKVQKKFNNPQQIFSFFVDQLFENNKETNLIFSLIDNDSTFICSLGNSSLEDINMIKKIAKSFFIWADLRIGLTKKEDKYVYFIGLLSIIQKLRLYFQEDYFVFWILIGLSQYMAHFHQQNPLFTDEMNYINIYGLVTKLILENHQKEIYNKFISLNFPPEYFLSRHLSTLYTDYFNNELMMRIFDILIFESSFQGLYGDNLQYLRILCAIPITLFELSKNRILACKSVSEIESICNDLILHTFNFNKFIFSLEKNVNKFYVISNILEKWFFNNRGREWDSKRDEIQNLINQHFVSVYKENTNYLYPISLYLTNNPQQMYKFYFENLDNKLNSIKSLYFQGTSNFDDSNSITALMVHISNLQQIYNNETNIEEYKLVLSFGDIETEIGNKYEKRERRLSFDRDKNSINNIQDLFFKEQFNGNTFPKYIHFALTDNQYNIKASFAYKILNFEPMKISKIILENKEENKKYFLEFVLFKYTTKVLSADDIALFNIIFSPPEYLHSKLIEEKLYSYSISNYSFNKNITQLIKGQNNNRNAMVVGDIFDVNLIEMYKKLNNNIEYEDKYNSEKIINNNNSFNEKISQKILKILDSCLQENIQNLVNKWLNNSNLSPEELFYSIILVDRSLISINEKLLLLFSIAQTRDKLLFNSDNLNVNKIKEMIYSLYKRFMIYFTKTDVERMIDFLLKDERLFNIKYAFVYNKNNTEKINEFIYDKDHYDPKLGKKKSFEIFFDDINKELNIYLSHLNNHYNLNYLSKDLLIYILSKILNNLDLTKYIQYKFDTITLIIEKDNMILKRNYNIKYSPLKINEEYNPIFDVNPKDPEDITNVELCNEISNLDINNSYSVNNYISFDKFKEIFFKLPYLSDLFRVSSSYISENKDTYDKEFDYFKVTIGYEDYYHGIFYFPQNLEENNIENEYEGNIGYDMNCKIKITDTVDHIINKIIKTIDDKMKLNNNEIIIRDYLKSIDKISCYICSYINENQKDGVIKEKIGYFDSLYSCMELRNKNIIEMQIIFNSDLLTFNSKRDPVPRGRGYCKIFYSNNNDFIWKKCKVKSKDISNAKLTSTDYKTIPNILNKEDDVVLAFNI